MDRAEIHYLINGAVQKDAYTGEKIIGQIYPDGRAQLTVGKDVYIYRSGEKLLLFRDVSND